MTVYMGKMKLYFFFFVSMLSFSCTGEDIALPVDPPDQSLKITIQYYQLSYVTDSSSFVLFSDSAIITWDNNWRYIKNGSSINLSFPSPIWLHSYYAVWIDRLYPKVDTMFVKRDSIFLNSNSYWRL